MSLYMSFSKRNHNPGSSSDISVVQ